MIGAPSPAYGGQQFVSAFHLYVKDCDAVCERAVKAGATLTAAPVDQPYGERSGAVRDAFGNQWYIATAKGPNYTPQGMQALMVYLHPHRAEPRREGGAARRAGGDGDGGPYVDHLLGDLRRGSVHPPARDRDPRLHNA